MFIVVYIHIYTYYDCVLMNGNDINFIAHKIGRALVAQGISIAFAIRSFDLLVCACHNLTDCGTEECHYSQACVIFSCNDYK